MDQRPNHSNGVLEYDFGDGVMSCVALDGGGSGEVRLHTTSVSVVSQFLLPLLTM